MRAWKSRYPDRLTQGHCDSPRGRCPRRGGARCGSECRCAGFAVPIFISREGDLSPRRPGTVPGHEVVGTVDAAGPGSHFFSLGQRVGAAWLASTCGECRFCTSGRENLCLQPQFTGWDVDGGYAEYMIANEDFLYPLTEEFDDIGAAPLLCAGIIGFRALRRADLPPRGDLGLYGFGGSAHLTAQIAMAEGATVHVMTRSEVDRDLARKLGAASVGGPEDRPPQPLDAASCSHRQDRWCCRRWKRSTGEEPSRSQGYT